MTISIDNLLRPVTAEDLIAAGAHPIKAAIIAEQYRRILEPCQMGPPWLGTLPPHVWIEIGGEHRCQHCGVHRSPT